MNEREIQKIHRSTLTAEHREGLLLEAIGKLRKIIGGVETIADINSEGCEDDWMAVLNTLSFADTYIGEVLKDNEERKQEEKGGAK